MGVPDIDTALDWRGRTVVDGDSVRIGPVRELYLDGEERPAWASVDTALFDLHYRLVPLAKARRVGERLQLPYGREHVRRAPRAGANVQLSREEEERVLRHYGIADRSVRTRPAAALPAGEKATVGPGKPRAALPPGDGATALPPAPDDATALPPAADKAPVTSAESQPREDDATMIRSEEEVRIRKRRRPRERVRLKKYLVTDYVEKQVPVRRERVRVEYEPADDDRWPADDDQPCADDNRPPAEDDRPPS